MNDDPLKQLAAGFVGVVREANRMARGDLAQGHDVADIVRVTQCFLDAGDGHADPVRQVVAGLMGASEFAAKLLGGGDDEAEQRAARLCQAFNDAAAKAAS